MNFLEKYNTYHTTVFKTSDEKSIKMLLKTFESPARKSLQLFVHYCLTCEDSILEQLICSTDNKVNILDNFIKSVDMEKLPIVAKNKKVLKRKIKKKHGLMLETDVSIEEWIEGPKCV